MGASEALALYGMSNIISSLIVGLIFFGIFYMIISVVFLGTKSQRHRKLQSDLYVAGKIRQIAKKEGVDLNEELQEMLKMIKEQRKYTKPLDDTIELELQDKIMKDSLGSKTGK